MAFLGLGRRQSRRFPEPVVPQGYNYPASTAGDTGIRTQAKPKGLAAPLAAERPDVTLDQRLSERISAFSTRLPIQNWLREQKVVQVVPQMGIAHKIDAAPRETALASGLGAGMYNTDYTLQTQMGRVHAGSFIAPPQFQSVPGFIDASATIAINGQYASINGNLAGLYTNLRAPGPFEGMASCQ